MRSVLSSDSTVQTGAIKQPSKPDRYHHDSPSQSGAKPWYRSSWYRSKKVVIAAALLLAFAALEIHSSWIESWVLPIVARRATFSLHPGPSHAVAPPAQGPYDQRLGLTQLPHFLETLQTHGYTIAEQARDSSISRGLAHLSIPSAYPEKSQAGLLILDRHDQPLFHVLYPHQVYPNFRSIPPLIVNTLLFIENREMLDRSHPRHNPAIQWGRLSRAAVDLGIHAVDPAHPVIGGSTLATQLEKVRHSPSGRTNSVVEKVRQMLSASLRVYRNGPNTIHAQEQVICDYEVALDGLPVTDGDARDSEAATVGDLANFVQNGIFLAGRLSIDEERLNS